MILTWPTSSELLEIQQDLLPLLTEDDLAYELLPMRNHDAALVEWEQRDNFTGLMQVRGPDAEPPSTPNVGFKRLRMEPGVYGEWAAVKESDIIFRRQPGSYNQPIAIDDLIVSKQDYLLSRRLDRIRWIIWTLLVTGAFTVPGPNGGILAAGSFAIQTVTTAIQWTTYATAIPIGDMRAAILKFRGITAGLKNGYAIMNQATANNMLLNSNAADLGGRRVNGANTINAIGDVNTILVANELPEIVIYDKGYYPDPAGTPWTPFIPDGKVILIGSRPNGESMGEFQFTRNASNPNGEPGTYTYVSDSLDSGQKVPRKIRIDDGFNGGPAMFFPSLVIVLTVY